MKREISRQAVACITILLACSCNDEVEFQGFEAELVDPPLLVTESFVAGERRDEQIKYDFDTHTIKRDLTLSDVTTQTVSIHQVERTQRQEEWQQGNDGQETTERFDVAEAGRLDLAIVVDDSSSMSEEHVNLAAKLEALLSELSGVDWRMGVSTTTSSCLRAGGAAINSTDPDYAARYIDAVSPGTGGDADERGLEAGADLLRGTCEGESWLRDDSTVAVLFVSDEDSYCGWKCKGDEKPETFVSTMKSLRPGRKDLLRAYALTWNPDDCSGSRESEGKRYEEVVDAIGGLTLPICGDYGDLLAQISADVAGAVKKQVLLARVPEAGVAVTIDGQAFTDYRLAGKVLKLGSLPSNAKLLEVTYLHDPAPKQQDFQLAELPNVASMVVKVNSEVLPEDAFTVIGNELHLVTMPGNNAVIEADYRIGSDLSSQFSLATVPAIGDLVEVAVDGQEAEYSVDGDILDLLVAPADGAKISIRYTEGTPVFDYPVDVPQMYAIEDVTAIDTVSGDSVLVGFLDGVITIAEEDYRPARELTLQFSYYLDARVADFEFPEHAVEATLLVDAEDANCTHEFSDQGALFVSCDKAVDVLSIGYEVYVPTEILILQSDYPAEAVIHVWQGDQPIEFERDGRQLRLLTIPDEGQELLVEIQVPA